MTNFIDISPATTAQAQVAAKLSASGLTSADLARKLGISVCELSSWLTGDDSVLTTAMEAALWAWLFADVESPAWRPAPIRRVALV